MARSGVYQILHKSTGHRYIGGAEDIDERWKAHVRDLKRGKHRNRVLQYAWDTSGGSLELTVVEEVPKDQVDDREQHYISALKPEFNLAEVVGKRSLGREKKFVTTVRLSEATRENMHKLCKGLHMSQSELLDKALLEWGERHGMLDRYQVTLTKDHIVVTKFDGENASVVEVTARNGTSPKQIQEKYAAQFHSPVALVETKGGGEVR